jgi:5-methyltetrahydrofolate--homocysteine methyltransferase
MNATDSLHEAVVVGDWDLAALEASRLLEIGVSPQELIEGCLRPAMATVGDRFSVGDYFLPDLLMAGRAMSRAMDIIRPLVVGKGIVQRGRVVLGTVQGDIHDIGKNMVAMFLQGTGFEVDDLGVDVSDEAYVHAVRERHPDILGLSALLTTTMPRLRSIIMELDAQGLRNTVLVVVGGAPVTQRYADQIGADGYAPDAGAAAKVCRHLMESRHRGVR